MTLRERQIVSAYTGTLMCDIQYVKDYASEVMERPVFTHELAEEDFWRELKDRVKPEFLVLCGNDS